MKANSKPANSPSLLRIYPPESFGKLYLSCAEKGYYDKQHYRVAYLINVLKMKKVKSEIFQ